MGLMLGIELTRPARPVLEKCHELGLLVNVTADTVVRLLPPYIITAADCDRALEILDQALAAVGSAG